MPRTIRCCLPLIARIRALRHSVVSVLVPSTAAFMFLGSHVLGLGPKYCSHRFTPGGVGGRANMTTDTASPAAGQAGRAWHLKHHLRNGCARSGRFQPSGDHHRPRRRLRAAAPHALCAGAEDGTLPLLECTTGADIHSGDLVIPGDRGPMSMLFGDGLSGWPKKKAPEKICTDEAGKQTQWEESEQAVAPFFKD